MTEHEFFDSVINAKSISEFENVLNDFLQNSSGDFAWIPFGDRENNRGTIEAAADPGRSLVERLTNGIDAILEEEYAKHNGIPTCQTPKEAASSWMNIPKGGLSEMTPTERRSLAQKLHIKIEKGEDKSSRIVHVRDYGIGIKPDEMKKTILSLNESNKISKYYVVGAYGQGGSSTLASSKYIVIATKNNQSEQIGFTIAKYEDLPAEKYKTGRYVYLVKDNVVLTVVKTASDFPDGTLVKHFGYDLTSYSSPLGPNSVYGLLNQTLFDPILPVWLINEVHDYKRVIKGSRNALNGSVDDGDGSGPGPQLAHNVRMFYTDLSDFGRIGIEYWVLDKPTSNNKRPSAAFVNPSKPIILSINGQNHAEINQSIIRKDSDLPYLGNRLICHVDCNYLTPQAKRMLFVSNREGARSGIVYDLIVKEIIKVLRSDDYLLELNNQAREEGVKEKDENAIKEMRSEVAKILRMQGVNVGLDIGSQTSSEGDKTGKSTTPRRIKKVVSPIEIKEPPTYIRIIWDEEEPITFYKEQRRYIRIETDAGCDYFDSTNPTRSRINVIININDVLLRGATPLENGRMRLILEAKSDVIVNSSGNLRIELSRTGLTTLADEKLIKIVETPPTKKTQSTITLPPFDIIGVEDKNDPNWLVLDWPDDENSIASSSIFNEGKLEIYYSKVFPKFLEQFNSFEKKDTVLSNSFRKRYEVWIAVHSLLFYYDQTRISQTDDLERNSEDSMIDDIKEKQERCRLATIASMIAAREVRFNPTSEEE